LTSRTRSLAVLATVLPALAIPATAGATTLIGSGSSAEQPILTALFAAYHKVKPSVNILYTADGGNAGAKDVQQGRSQFAINTRAPLPTDTGLTYVKVFKDGLCVAVNPANHLTNLPAAQLANIFLGNLTSWSSLPGTGLTSTIAPFGRASSAGSYTFFQSVILNGQTQASSVAQEQTDGEVAVAVKGNPSGIGYVGLSHTRTGSGIKTVAVNGVACTPAKIKSGAYLLNRYIWFVVPTAKSSKAAVAFATWIRTKAAAQVIDAAGAVATYHNKNIK
jgi:ABC-type phosphate transport system substrate-binding protein